MARKKIKLAFIENHSQRKATYNKRKRGIIKKLTEITTLCDVEACAIIYNPDDQNRVVWPSEEEARKVAGKFKDLPEMNKSKKMVDQQAHLEQRITKTNDKNDKLRRETKGLEMEQVLSQSFMGNWSMNISDLNNLGYMADRYLSNIMRNIKIQHEACLEIGESSNVVFAASEGIASTMVMASTTAPVATNHEVSSSSTSAAFYRPIQQHPQFQHPPYAPYVGLSQNSNLSLNQNQQQELMEMINHHAQLRNAAEQLGFPFMDQQQHQSQPHQPTIGDSTASAAPSPSNVVPTTNPNPSNNI